MTFNIVEQDLIDQYEHVAEPFFAKVLGLEYGQWLISDESTLSDFSMSNLPQRAIPPKASYKDSLALWDVHMKNKIRECFGIEVASTAVRLVDLFQRIDVTLCKPTLH